jgi:hypothetical protein
MLEFMTYAFGAVLIAIALGLLSLAVSYIKDGKAAISAGAIAVALFIAAAWLFGYPVWPKLYALVTNPVLLLAYTCGYVIAGFTYSFVRWWRLNRAVRNAMQDYLRSFTANKIRVTTNDTIANLLFNYSVANTVDAADSKAMADINYGRNCKNLRELSSLVFTSLPPTLTMAKITSWLPAEVREAVLFVDNLEHTGGVEEFANNPTLAKMPTAWQEDWKDYRLQMSVSFNEGFSTDYVGLRKPLLQDHMGRISSWIMLWPVCLIVNTFFDFADIARSLTDAAVKRLSKLYDKLAGDWE